MFSWIERGRVVSTVQCGTLYSFLVKKKFGVKKIDVHAEVEPKEVDGQPPEKPSTV